MNIFYGVIILNLEELDQQKEDIEGSQAKNSETQLEKELRNIRMELQQHKVAGRKARETIAVVEICELSLQNMVET